LLDGLISNTNGLPYAHIKEDDCISPIHLWIEEACSGACQTWHVFVLLSRDNDPTSVLDQRVVEIPTHVFLMCDVSLFWFVTRHKGRFFGINELIKWLHWNFYFT
jgi:hypothetical protein